MRLPDPDVLLRAGRSRVVQGLIGAAFVFYLILHLTRFRLSHVWPLAPTGDAWILLDYSLRTFARSAYPAEVFPYSPSGVLLFAGLGAAGPAAFMLAWYMLMAAGLIVSVRAALTQERAAVRAAWPLIGAFAVVLADPPIRWDLRNANSNLIYLGLVMAAYGLAGRRPLLAGTLGGVSISLKLYSGLLLGWLLVNGPRRMFYAGAAAMIVLWIALPIAFFGFDGTLQLYAGWKHQVERISDPALHAFAASQPAGPPLVTLHKAIVNLIGESFHSPQTIGLLWLLRAVWIAALLWYAWRCRRHLPAAVPSRAALADWTVLLLAPLPFSPWLEPYHAIPLLIGAVLCVAIALDQVVERRDRMAALAAIGILLLVLILHVPFALRGLGLLGQFLVMTAVLGLIRPRLARSPAEV